MTTAFDQNLTWKEAELTQKERTWGVHGLHPYLGKFPPQLPASLIERFSSPGETVLDPFVGSCTTGVEALRLGRRFIGVDVAPFNVLLSRVKTGLYDLPALKAEVDDFISRIYLDDNQYEIPPFFEKWYSPEAARTLMSAREILKGKGRIWWFKSVLQVIVSRTARSSRQAPHFQLDFPREPVKGPYYCFKHKRECTPTASAWPFLARYAKDAVKRITEYDSVRGNQLAYILQGDIRNPSLLNSHSDVKLAVGSPPYLGGIDYHAQHEYAYELFPDDLPRHDDLEIGPASGGRSKKAQRAYVEGMVAGLKNVATTLAPRGIICLVANDSHFLYDTIREQCGLEEVERMHRLVDRRTGLRSTTYSETIFIWQKP